MSVKVSFVVPVYNAKPYVEDCLASILNQTFNDYEVIIINDGSTDGSEKICEMFCRNDPRFLLLSQVNRGPAEARNKGLSYASGEYVLFVDADDITQPDMLSDLLPIIECCNLDLISFNFSVIKDGCHKDYPISIDNFEYTDKLLNQTEMLKAYAFFKLIHRYAWCHIYRKDFLEKNNIKFPADIKCCEDMYFMYLVFTACESWYVASKSYYNHRIHFGGIIGEGCLLSEKRLTNYYTSFLAVTRGVIGLPDFKFDFYFKNNLLKNILIAAAEQFSGFQCDAVRAMVLLNLFDFETKIAFFGASLMGIRYLHNFEEHNMKNIIFVDSNIKKVGKLFHGYPIIAPENIKAYADEGFRIVISSVFMFEIFKTLRVSGVVKSFGDIGFRISDSSLYKIHIKYLDEIFKVTMAIL